MSIANSDGQILYEWDDDNRTYIDHVAGTSRPYTDEENAAADQRQTQEVNSTNEETLLAGLENVIARALDYQAKAQEIIDDTNQNINSSPAKHIKALARAQKRSAGDIIRLARIAGQMYDSADTGNSE